MSAGPVITTHDQLKKIDEALAKFVGGQEAFQQRLAEVEKASAENTTAMEKRLAAVDEGLRAVKRSMEEVAAPRDSGALTRAALIPLLTEQQRSACEAVYSLSPTIPAGAYGLSQPEMVRSATQLGFARSNPLAYVGIGAFFTAKLKAALANRKSNNVEAARQNELADKLEQALGGIAPQSKVAMQEDVNAEGGFMTPTIVEAMIGWVLKEYGVARRAGATVLQMSAKSHQLPSLANDFTTQWTTEEGLIVDGVPASPFSGGLLTAKKITSLATISIELIQDNVVALMDFVFAHMLQQAGRAEDFQVFEGDGTVFSGLFSAAGVNVTAGGSAALTEAMLRKLIYGGEHQATIEGGTIFCHPWIVRDAMGLATNQAIWYPFLLANQQAPSPRNIWGQPTFPSSIISRTRGGGSNETTAYHGNPSYIVIGDRMGATFDLNPWSETEFKRAQVVLRLIRRVAVQIFVPAYFTKLTAVIVTP